MNRRFVYTFVIIGLFVGLLLAWQFKSEILVTGGFAADEALARQNLLDEFLDEQGYLQDKIVKLREEIGVAESELNLHSSEANLEVLNELRKQIGLFESRGPGVEIVLNDGPFTLREGANVSTKELVQASDIRDIINVLWASNAEAISVNGQRVIATSPIASVGTTILVNNAYTSPPFEIIAVGDTDIMLQRILNDTLLKPIHKRSSEGQIALKVIIKELLYIPVYSGDLKTNYLNLVN